MKNTLLLAIIVLFFGCAKEPPKATSTPKPSETVLKVYDALGRQDSASFVNLVSTARRQAYSSDPHKLSVTLAYWKDQKPSVEIVSESHDGTIAIVTYKLKTIGDRAIDTTITTQLYLEGGAWKYGS
jgi:hypothetical protein